MASWENFKSVIVPATPAPAVKSRFSLTSDIVSFRRCSRQYGFFGNDGYVPAQAVQIYYGTIIHQVLDRCHRHYAGVIGGNAAGTFPTDAEVEHYFGEVENALKSHGVRPANHAMRDQALQVLQAFNRVEGPAFYPRVFDTEYRLESDRNTYVLRGVVDVLVEALGAKGSPGDMEIWDYKGTNMPDLKSPEMKDYEWQMCVYAQLYKDKCGHYPKKALLYFLNELKTSSGAPAPTTRPLRAVLEVHFTPQKIQDAINEFDKTAKDIMGCRKSQNWPVPKAKVAEATCTICDLRWSCPKVTGRFALRNVI